jgi:uncharacterized membrane protein YeaQ/YmgE (transglycosylase-associated protein family)
MLWGNHPIEAKMQPAYCFLYSSALAAAVSQILNSKLMFHIIWSILVGFVVGLIARHLMPAVEHMGFIETTLVGIGGSVVGGLIARLFSRPADGAYFHPAGFFMSIVGAVIVLYVMLHYFPGFRFD